MKVLKLLTKQELADLLRTSAQTITNQIGQGKEGITVPPAIMLGRKYMWNQETVIQWMQDKEHERKVLIQCTEENFKAVSRASINKV